MFNILFQTIWRLSWWKFRIELLHKQGLLPAEIFGSLKAEGLLVSIARVIGIVKKFKINSSVANLPRSGRPTKMSEGAFSDRQIWEDDKMTSSRIQKNAGKMWDCREFIHCAKISKATRLDSTAAGYCQLICDINKTKRLEFVQSVLESGVCCDLMRLWQRTSLPTFWRFSTQVCQ